VNFPKYPYQPFDEPIPAPQDDKGALCFSIDAKWRPYLIGLLKTLLVERTWESDEVRASGEASQLLTEILTAEFCKIPNQGIGGDDCMGCCLRIENGVLQQFTCGEWVDVGDLKTIAAGSGQPAQGAPQPAAGECTDFIAKVLFGGRWLLPVPVSEGDVITVNNVLGATSGYILDGLTYRCGDGDLFLAGGCVTGSEVFNGSNPDPSSPQDCLLGFDGVNYYDCSNAANHLPVTITIPSGILSQNFVFLINNPGPGGAGDLTFDVRICKAAETTTFTHTFDFEHDDGGWVNVVDAIYVPGSGWNTSDNGTHNSGVIDLLGPSYTLLTARVLLYQATPQGAAGHYFARVGFSPDFFLPDVVGINDSGVHSINADGTHLRIDFSADHPVIPSIVKKVVLTGIGSDPY